MTVAASQHAPRHPRSAAPNPSVPAPRRRPGPSLREQGALHLLRTFATLPRDDPRRHELRPRVIQAWLPFARRLARRFHDRGEPMDDLLQTAVIGLIKAIDRFDPTYGNDFVAFAVPTVAGEVRRHFRDRTWNVRIPRRLQELKLDINAATPILAQRLGASPTVTDLAAYLQRDEGEILEALDVGRAYTAVSLNSPFGGDTDGAELADLIGTDDPDLATVEIRAALDSAMRTLPPREQTIIALRFFGNLGQTQIAQRIGISQMHVSRLLNKSLATMREHLTAEP